MPSKKASRTFDWRERRCGVNALPRPGSRVAVDDIIRELQYTRGMEGRRNGIEA